MSDQDTTGYDSSLDAFYDRASARIRHTLHNSEPFYSVVDMVALLTDSPTPRQYWSDLKRRLAEDEGFHEVSEKIEPLKMEAPDGKQRPTDCANEETILRIIESIPSPKAEPFKQWLAKVGHERLQELEQPALAADRMRAQHKALKRIGSRGDLRDSMTSLELALTIRSEATATELHQVHDSHVSTS